MNTEWLMIIFGVSFALYFVNCRLETNGEFPSCAVVAIAFVSLIISADVFGLVGSILGALDCQSGYFICPQIYLGLRVGRLVGFGAAAAGIIVYAARETATHAAKDRD